ncbi:MAG TPA: VanW family protein [Nitriliruptorales bacterium]|nr:VanW family protein [Nitriliruptorales bacterium]
MRLTLTSTVAVVGLLAGLHAVHRGEALPGVAVEGVEVGGLGHDQVRATLGELVAARQEDPVVLTHGDQRFTYIPGTQGYSADVDSAVAAAMAPGRDRDLLADTWAHIAALWHRRIDVSLVDAQDRTIARTFLSELATQVDREPFPGAVSADPATLEVRAEPPVDGQVVRQDETLELLLAAVREPGPQQITLPVDVIPTRTTAAQVEAVGAQALRALEAPLTLTAHGETVVLRPPDLARLISSDVRDDEVVLAVPAEAVGEVFAPHLDALEVEPRSATFELVSGLTTFDEQGNATWRPQPAQLRIVESADGFRFDPERVATQLTGLLAPGQRQAALDMVVEHPQLTTEQAQALGITNLIGTFTTYHKCCQSRVDNIHRIADLVRGKVIRPGERFSLNQHVGERTRAKGFVPAGAIFNGEYRDEVGGGVSQFATTTFNAAFFAGLPIEEHKAHSYYISRYPRGREGTVSWPSVDLVIRNDTSNGIYVHTSYTDTSITVSLFGDNGGRQVTAEMGEPFNRRGPETRYRDDPSRPSGFTRVVQSGGTGFDVEVFRVIDHGGRSERQRFFTRYLAEPRIEVRGTGEPGPAPETAPTEASGAPTQSSEPPPSPQPSPAPTS